MHHMHQQGLHMLLLSRLLSVCLMQNLHSLFVEPKRHALAQDAGDHTRIAHIQPHQHDCILALGDPAGVAWVDVQGEVLLDAGRAWQQARQWTKQNVWQCCDVAVLVHCPSAVCKLCIEYRAVGL